MDVFSSAGDSLSVVAAAALVLAGITLFWRGVRGGRQGERGLLRRRAATLGRIEGWRLTVLGLAAAGIGAAWQGDAPWLFFLALGIGFVEVLEASFVIAAWRRDGWRRTTATPRATGRRPRRGGDDPARWSELSAGRPGERPAAHPRGSNGSSRSGSAQRSFGSSGYQPGRPGSRS